MKYLIILVVTTLTLSCKSQLNKKLQYESYQAIHEQAILVDTHNDFLLHTHEKGFIFDTDLKGKTHSDLERLIQGGVDVQFFSVWCDGEQADPYNFSIQQMDSLDAVVKRNQDRIIQVANTKELDAVVDQHKVAAIIGIEGGHMMEDDLEKLHTFYARGVRYMTLTWNNSTSWATSAVDETSDTTLTRKGLTDFGRQVVQRMNHLGMMIDVSHVGEQTFWDVIETTSNPIIASHSSVYSLCAHPRNLKDDQIKAIAKNGGVAQINFYSGFIDPNYGKNSEAFNSKHKSEKDSLIKTGMNTYLATEHLFSKYHHETQSLRPPLSMLIDHIEYIIQLVGVDFVGLGSDFDGIESAPLGLNDVSDFPLITQALIQRDYSTEDINKILGRNLLRVLKANERQ